MRPKAPRQAVSPSSDVMEDRWTEGPPRGARNITMKRKLILILTATVGLLANAGPVFAHHSGANYDRENLITLSGTVTEFEFTNPHAQIHFDGKDAQGNIVKWVAVGDPPKRLYSLGWTKTTVKPGDQITLTGGPRKDRKPEIDMRNDQVMLNGKKLGQKGGGQ